MTTFVLTKISACEVAHALTAIGRCQVIYTASIGDAASPVWYVAGQFSETRGQVADYRHDVEAYAERQGCAAVIGSWDNDLGWCVSVTADLTDDQVRRLCRKLGRRTLAEIKAAEERAHQARLAYWAQQEAERPAREAAAARVAAEQAARREEYRPIYDAAMSRVRIKANGRRDRGEARRVNNLYQEACEGLYRYDRERALGFLRQLAGLEVATA